MQSTVSIKEAAEILNVSQQYLRDMMRFKLIDIGVAVKLPNKQQYHYIVFKDKLNSFIGRDNDNE